MRTGRRSLWSPGGKAPQDAAAGSGHASWGMSALVAPKLDASCCHGKKLIIAILCQQRAVTPMSGADRSSARAPLRHGESDSARTGDHRVVRSKADHRRDRPPSVSQFRYSRRGWHRYRVVPDEPRMPGPRRAQRDRASAALPSHRRPAPGCWRATEGRLALDGGAIGRPGCKDGGLHFGLKLRVPSNDEGIKERACVRHDISSFPAATFSESGVPRRLVRTRLGSMNGNAPGVWRAFVFIVH